MTKHVIYINDSPVGHEVGPDFAAFVASRHDWAMGVNMKTLNPDPDGDYIYPDPCFPEAVRSTRETDPDGWTITGFFPRFYVECPFTTEAEAQEWADAINHEMCHVITREA